MSIGLGSVEKTILKALKRCGDLDLNDLAMVFRYGYDIWDNPDKLEEIGTFESYAKSSATWQSTARAVRSLARKGLVNCTRQPDKSEEDGRRKSTKVAMC